MKPKVEVKKKYPTKGRPKGMMQKLRNCQHCEKELAANPLRVGLSMTVTVDISSAGTGKNMAATAERNTTLQEADSVDWAAADALIEQIFEKYAK